MEEDVSAFLERKGEILKWLAEEYVSIPSGALTPSLVDRVVVKAYGGTTHLSHCAAIALQDRATILITPYDISLLQSIETALREQMDMLEISVGDTSVRVKVGAMTGERRVHLERLAKERMEEAKKSIRGVREKVLSYLKQQKTAKEISEDEEFAEKKQLQEAVEAANAELETLYANKLQDIQL